MQRAVASVLAIVRRTIVTHGLLERGERLLVAISGGPDSTALLAVLAEFRARWNLELVAGHVNHGLRGDDAAADEAGAAWLAARLGVPFCSRRLAPELRRGGNLEARAREERYHALHAMAEAQRCTRIATGHTQDDQAETILLRLARGSGPAGLAGIEPQRADGVIRPLLDCTRAQLLDLLVALGLPYRIDRMNDDTRFQRVRVRQEVLAPLRSMNPRIAAALGCTAALARAERAIVQRWVETTLDEVTRGPALELPALGRVPASLRGYVLRGWLIQRGAPERRLSARHIAAVRRVAESGHPSAAVSLPAGFRVQRRYEQLCVDGPTEGPPRLVDPRPLSAGESLCLPSGWQVRAGRVRPVRQREARPCDLWAAVCDADRLDGPLFVRPARRGERVRPIGLAGTRKLSDVFVDAKVPARERASYPLIEYAGEILWVPGLVRAEALRLSADTRTVLWLRATRGKPVAGSETPC